MPDEVEIFVCVSCTRHADSTDTDPKPGRALVSAINERLAEANTSGIAVRGVECLAVCKRPCTIAMIGPGKWTYVIGDLEPAQHVGDVVDAAIAFQRAPNGIVPWGERPVPFRKGVISRIPPMGFEQPETESA
jgi:predicted metal-binding protein